MLFCISVLGDLYNTMTIVIPLKSNSRFDFIVVIYVLFIATFQITLTLSADNIRYCRQYVILHSVPLIQCICFS